MLLLNNISKNEHFLHFPFWQLDTLITLARLRNNKYDSIQDERADDITILSLILAGLLENLAPGFLYTTTVSLTFS